MKTLATFLPRLAGADYVTVSTCRFCDESDVTPAFTRLREALQGLCTLLASLRREEDIRISAPQVLRAAQGLRQAENAYFYPPAVSLVGHSHEESLLPDWSCLCRVREQLAPLLDAADAEIRRLLADASLLRAATTYLCRPSGSLAAGGTEEFLFETTLPETEPVFSFAEKRFASFMADTRALCADIAGGNGLTCETAIVLKGVGEEAISEEYDLFRRAYGISPRRQFLMSFADRYYDVLVQYRDEADGTPCEYTLWFDITAYWKHCHGKHRG